jgi:hypothetical protein
MATEPRFACRRGLRLRALTRRLIGYGSLSPVVGKVSGSTSVRSTDGTGLPSYSCVTRDSRCLALLVANGLVVSAASREMFPRPRRRADTSRQMPTAFQSIIGPILGGRCHKGVTAMPSDMGAG